MVGGGLLCGLLGLSLIALPLLDPTSRSKLWVVLPLGAAFLAAGAATVWHLRRYKLTMYPDRLEYDSGFGRFVLARAEIGGLRLGGMSGMRLYRAEDLKLVQSIGLGFAPDEEFCAWFDGIKDLDTVAAEAEVDAVAEDPTFGSTPEDRLAFARRQSERLLWFIRLSLAVTAWGFFYPYPYPVAIAANALVPVLAFLWLFKLPKLVGFETRARSPKQGMAVPITLCSLALGIRAVMDTRPVEPLSLVLPAGLCTIGTGFVLYKSRAEPKWQSLLGSTLVLASYPAGLIALTNEFLDRHPPTPVQVTVLSKDVSGGKVRTWNLELSPGGPWQQPHAERVSRDLYEHTSVGDTRCLLLRPGALGIRWWEIRKTCEHQMCD